MNTENENKDQTRALDFGHCHGGGYSDEDISRKVYKFDDFDI